MDPQHIKIMNRQSRTKRRSNEDLGAQCVKFLLHTTNLLFILTGTALIVGGIIINSYLDRLGYFLQGNGKILPELLVGFGVLILLVSLFGCIGGMKSCTAWMNIYGLLLLVALVLEITGAAFYFSSQRQADLNLLRTMKDSMKQYQTDDNSAYAWDYLQRGFYCCGAYSQREWNDVLVRKTTPTTPAYTTSVYYQRSDPPNVPDSCCSYMNHGECGYVFENGCYQSFSDILAISTYCVAIGVAVLALVQVFGAVVAFKFAKIIRKEKSERDAREWQTRPTMDTDNESNMPEDNADVIDTDDVINPGYRFLTSSLSCACVSASCMVSYTKPGE